MCVSQMHVESRSLIGCSAPLLRRSRINCYAAVSGVSFSLEDLLLLRLVLLRY